MNADPGQRAGGVAVASTWLSLQCGTVAEVNLHNLFSSAVLLQFISDFFLLFYFYHKDNPRYFEENFLRKNVFELIDYKNIRYSELGRLVSLAIRT